MNKWTVYEYIKLNERYIYYMKKWNENVKSQEVKKPGLDEDSNQEREKSPPRPSAPGRGKKRGRQPGAGAGENMSSAASTCSEDSERSNDFYGEWLPCFTTQKPTHEEIPTLHFCWLNL